MPISREESKQIVNFVLKEIKKTTYPFVTDAKIDTSLSMRGRFDGKSTSPLPRSVQGYYTDVTFSYNDYDTITWVAGTIKFYDGTVQSISSGSLDLADDDLHYIYFDYDYDNATPEVLLNTTNYVTTIDPLCGVLCIVKRGSAADIAPMIIPSYGKQPLITADTIQLSSLTMDRLADGTEYKRIKSAALTADHLIFLDAVVASGVYGLVANTDISAGHIYLSTTIKDSSNRTVSDAEKGVWDDKAKTFRQDAAPTTGMQAGDIWYDTNDGDKPYTYDGADWIASYTEIDGGYLTTGIIDCTKVTVRSVSGANKIEINANEIAGYAGATKQFYITAASGVAYCGTGAVVLDSSGISIQGASLKFKDQATGNVIGGAYGVLSSVEIYVESGVVLQLDSDGYASDMIMGFANVRPMQNGTMLLGGSSYRWSHGYINRVYANTRLQIPVGTDCYD